MTDWLVDRINENATAPVTEALKSNFNGNLIEKAGALKAWIAMTRGRATWDYKPDIKTSDPMKEYLPDISIGGVETNFQAIANLHFGAMASEVGLPQWFSEAGAGAFQILGNEKNNWGKRDTWFDDPADNYWIRCGYWLSESYGGGFGSLSADNITEAISTFSDE